MESNLTISFEKLNFSQNSSEIETPSAREASDEKTHRTAVSILRNYIAREANKIRND